MSYDEWCVYYEQWHDNARIEFIESEYYDTSIEDNFEVSEDGNVYMDNMHYIKGVVTRWEDSEYFVETI